MSDEAEPAKPAEQQLVDIVSDELALARAQMAGGLPGVAEGTLRRRLARLEADGAGDDEVDALRVLLAEALWRQQRPVAARVALDGVRAASPQRRLPIALLIDAETLAASGEADRAAGARERLLAAIGADEAFELLGGVPGRLTWPLPADMRPGATREPRPPWTAETGAELETETEPPDDERVAAARGRMEEARVAYVAGDRARGDAQMSIAVRLDAALAGDGVAIIEPTLGRQPASDRLLLYGDLLRAAGREAESTAAYDRAAKRRT
jgi:hypothetical protein